MSVPILDGGLVRILFGRGRIGLVMCVVYVGLLLVL